MEKAPFGGQPESREMMSPLEKTREELRQLTEEYNSFTTAIDGLFAGEDGEKLFKKVNAIRFNSEMVDRIGVKGEQAQVFYGDWNPMGNMEGSLYTKFDEDVLRVRWAGDHAIYLNGGGNYVDINSDKEAEGKYKLRPGRIAGRTILGMTEQGVETQNPEYYKYDQAMWDYRDKLAERERRQKNVLYRLQDKLTKRGKPEEPLVEPVKPENVVIPHQELEVMLQKIKDGLKRTISTLEGAKGTVE